MELKAWYPLISYRSMSSYEKSPCCCCDNSAVFIISARIDGVAQEYHLCHDHLETWVALIEAGWRDIVLQTVRTDRG
ncbi:hypothetical protein SAMN05421799_10655 [Alicyclobacillus vulcanalis]|uniref:Uncharacterized protein n=1 Tax=Alicyclobacillus vulcanalis TaxID=252246 RepID=A0A1N7MRR2_9BACL|nr:hypothetical protein SAMN05421799_10655 [Alicyclobacillus vulcanalis]